MNWRPYTYKFLFRCSPLCPRGIQFWLLGVSVKKLIYKTNCCQSPKPFLFFNLKKNKWMLFISLNIYEKIVEIFCIFIYFCNFCEVFFCNVEFHSFFGNFWCYLWWMDLNLLGAWSFTVYDVCHCVIC